MKKTNSTLKAFLSEELSSIIFFLIAISMNFPGSYGLAYKQLLLVIFVGYAIHLKYRVFILERGNESSTNGTRNEPLEESGKGGEAR